MCLLIDNYSHFYHQSSLIAFLCLLVIRYSLNNFQTFILLTTQDLKTIVYQSGKSFELIKQKAVPQNIHSSLFQTLTNFMSFRMSLFQMSIILIIIIFSFTLLLATTLLFFINFYLLWGYVNVRSNTYFMISLQLHCFMDSRQKTNIIEMKKMGISQLLFRFQKSLLHFQI